MNIILNLFIYLNLTIFCFPVISLTLFGAIRGNIFSFHRDFMIFIKYNFSTPSMNG